MFGHWSCYLVPGWWEGTKSFEKPWLLLHLELLIIYSYRPGFPYSDSHKVFGSVSESLNFMGNLMRNES